MTTIEITRQELINDLSKAYREQNDISIKTNDEIVAAWKKHGVHAGTWDWDEVIIVEEEQEE